MSYLFSKEYLLSGLRSLVQLHWQHGRRGGSQTCTVTIYATLRQAIKLH